MPEEEKDKEMHCPLFEKDSDEVELWIKNIIENKLRERDYTTSEINELTEIMNRVVESAIMRHQISCPLRKSFNDMSNDIVRIRSENLGEEKAQKKNVDKLSIAKDSVEIIAEIIIAIFAILGFILGVWSNF